jgi:hypothetical protein
MEMPPLPMLCTQLFEAGAIVVKGEDGVAFVVYAFQWHAAALDRSICLSDRILSGCNMSNLHLHTQSRK